MRIIIGMSGATGSIYGIRLLEVLANYPHIEKHLVMSNPARHNVELETDFDLSHIESLANAVHDVRDIGAPIASGSFKTDGMVIAPCSVKTLSAIANSYNDNLLVRAADVCLKERRKLVLIFRETPLHAGHMRQMLAVTEMGGVLLPPMPAFYHRPRTLDDIINQTIGKVLDMFDIDHNLFRRWGTPELMTRQQKPTITARIVPGVGESESFTRLPWVVEMTTTKLGIDPSPGTLNLAVESPEDMRLWQALKSDAGMEIQPGTPEFCKAKCLSVVIDGRIKGAIVFPDVPGYPADKLEVIASVSVKESLKLREGDFVTVTVVDDVPVRH